MRNRQSTLPIANRQSPIGQSDNRTIGQSDNRQSPIANRQSKIQIGSRQSPIRESAICNRKSSIEITSQLPRPLRPSQLLLRARFDLTDPLARQAEHVANLLQRARLAVSIEAEAQHHDFAFLVVE